MQHANERLVIESYSMDGRKFRPSDWIERISAGLAIFGKDHRLHYQYAVRPSIISGEKCLVVAAHLKEINPDAYDFILNFVQSNQLRMRRE